MPSLGGLRRRRGGMHAGELPEKEKLNRSRKLDEGERETMSTISSDTMPATKIARGRRESKYLSERFRMVK